MHDWPTKLISVGFIKRVMSHISFSHNPLTSMRHWTDEELALTYHPHRGGRVILSKRALNNACVQSALFYGRAFDNQTVVYCNRKPVSLSYVHAIFQPSNSWCWYSTCGTPDGDGSVGSCRHVITNVHCHWTAVTNGNISPRFITDFNGRFGWLCVEEMLVRWLSVNCFILNYY